MCDSGTYATSQGSATCTKCSVGSYSNNLQGPPAVCIPCSSGSFANETGMDHVSFLEFSLNFDIHNCLSVPFVLILNLFMKYKKRWRQLKCK